jgi:hypothetical protein
MTWFQSFEIAIVMMKYEHQSSLLTATLLTSHEVDTLYISHLNLLRLLHACNHCLKLHLCSCLSRQPSSRLSTQLPQQYISFNSRIENAVKAKLDHHIHQVNLLLIPQTSSQRTDQSSIRRPDKLSNDGTQLLIQSHSIIIVRSFATAQATSRSFCSIHCNSCQSMILRYNYHIA